MSEEKRNLVEFRYPFIQSVEKSLDIFDDVAIDAVVIVTPVHSHFDLALKALKSGKHVLVEKPMTETSDQAQLLINEAEKRGLTLMVDHTFVYTGSVYAIKELIQRKDLGVLYYYDSTRINLGLFQHDVNVIWDLAVHDFSILDYLIGSEAQAVSATGMAHIPGHVENICYITIYLPNELIAHINVNWLSPVKIRRTLIGGSEKMVVFDDLETSEKVKIYNKGITLTDNPESIYKMLVGYRTGDMYAPQIENIEALRVEAEHFVKCIETGSTSISGGAAGFRVVKLAEAASLSMARQGAPVELAN